MARTDPDDKGARRRLGLHRRARHAGPHRSASPTSKMGQRGAHTCDVIFDNCRVPAAQLIGGKEGAGLQDRDEGARQGRLHIAAVCVGVAERMIDDSAALRDASASSSASRSPSSSWCRRMLADCQTEALRRALHGARRRAQARRRRERHDSRRRCCKYFASEMVRPGRRPRRADLRRRRLRRRLRHRALLPRRAPVPPLRRHQPDPAARHRRT